MFSCIWGDLESHNVTVTLCSADQDPEGVFVGFFCCVRSKAVIISIDLRGSMLVLNTERDLWGQGLRKCLAVTQRLDLQASL